MTARLASICFEASDPLGLARFWAAALSWQLEARHGVQVVPTDGTPFGLTFLPATEPKRGKSRIHLDLVSETPGHRLEIVDRLVGLGAKAADIGQGEVPWTVLADPEGNEFCVVVRGEFLATTGLLGSVVFEPAGHDVCRFWSAATGWPLVYDEDGDTAIRHPSGQGPFLTFGPPALEPKTSRNRLHLDIAPPSDGDQRAEVDRLLALGARRLDVESAETPRVAMADPEGNEFYVLNPCGAST